MFPPFSLKAGDGVDLIAPSGALSVDEIRKCAELLKTWGLVPHLQPFCESVSSHPLHANDDDLRFKDLWTALTSSHSKAIWALKGGCGATRLIPRLFQLSRELDCIPAPKLLIGFSDITALHTFLIQEWKWITLHGPTLRDLVVDRLTPSCIQTLKDILFSSRKMIEETDLVPLNQQARHPGIIEAPLVGGNQSLLQYSIGTPWQLQSQGKILFLEDVNEQAYRIAERLEHFLQAGLLSGVRAILFGDYNYSLPHPSEDPSKLDYVFNAFAENIDRAVFKMSGYGHGCVNKPLFMGKTARLETGMAPNLTIKID